MTAASIWIATDAWRAAMADVGKHAAGAAFDLAVRCEGWPFRGELAPRVAAFFTEVRPNVWAPSPEFFIANNPELEGAEAPAISCEELGLA